MALTITIPGAVEATIGATAPAILTVGVGVPGATGATGATGAQGPQGDPGEGVPVGGSAGQVLAKIDGTNYNTEWVNVAGDYLPLAGGTMDSGAQINLSITPDFEALLTGSTFSLNDGSNYTTITPGKVELVFDDVALPFTIDVNGITFPDATVQTTAFNDVYLPLIGGTMTGDIYFNDANSYITYNAVVQSYDNSQGQTMEGSQGYTSYGQTGLSIRAQNWVSDGVGGFDPIFTYGSAVTGYGLTFVNFNGSARGGTVQYLSTGITFGNASVQTIAFPGFNNTALTGNPTAPTPATSDNDTSIATTAYVKAQAFGDRYLTTSTTSNTVSNGNKTFTIGTDLSYTPTQNITISYDASNHMHGEVLTYSTSTGVLTVDVNHHTGSGTYASWVVNVGGVTPATSVGWGDITGTLSTQTDLQNALDLKSNLASPAFTGTPSLPTGTTGITQTAGDNTTALATTAFVTAAIPAFATNAQIIAGTSTTTTLAPGNAGFLKADPRLRSLSFINGTSISGSGAVTTNSGFTFLRETYLSTLATGRAGYFLGVPGNVGFGGSTTSINQIDFSKKVWMSGYCNFGSTAGATSYTGDANTMCRITLAGYSSQTTGDMTLRGIGIKKVGGVSTFVTLTVHNGTNLTDVATTVAVADSAAIYYVIYSDGAGNVTLYINGTQAATTSAGPTSATANSQSAYREQVEAVDTPAVRQSMHNAGGWLYIE